MKPRDLVFEALVLSNPITQEGHGSIKRYRCNNPNCEINRKGGELHEKPSDQLGREIMTAYRRITEIKPAIGRR